MSEHPLRDRLERLRKELRGLVVLHGISRLLAAGCACLFLLYVLDRWLVLPAAMRLLLTLLGLGVLALLAWRDLWRPLRVRVEAEDVARAVEKRFPEFDGRLLTTLELERRGAAAAGSLLAELEERTGRILAQVEIRSVLRRRPAASWAAAAIAGILLEGGFAVLEPQLAGVFVERMLGRDVRWPRRVVLSVDFPAHGEHFRVERSEDGGVRRVVVAAGASLPVLVHAEGEAPRFVELRARWEGGRRSSVALTPTPRGEWVGRFKNVQASFRFHAHDGDPNDDSEPVAVDVVPAPVVRAVTTRLEYPPYTGLEPRSEAGGDVEAPVGTRVLVTVEADGEATGGWLEFEQRSGRVELERVPEGSLRGSFVVERSTSYTVRLVGTHGFSNLDRPTFGVIAVLDRPPTVRILQPSRAAVEVTPQGLVPFRVAADDDFGLASLSLLVDGGGEEPLKVEWVEEGASPQRALVVNALDLRTLQVPGPQGLRVPQVGDSFSYRVLAVDNRDLPNGEGPNRTEASGRRFDVVSVNELLRLLTERQMRLKEDVSALRDLQAAKKEKVEGWLSDIEASEGEDLPALEGLSSAEIGQAQVTTRATRLCGDFALLFERYLFNRIDRSAAAERLIPYVLERKRRSEQIDSFDFEVWKTVRAAYDSGTFGRLDVLGRLIAMLGLMVDVAATDSPAATDAVARARLASDARERTEGLQQALLHQQRVVERLDRLLELMDEWEDFQEIVTLLRDLLEDQRDLHARTRNALGGQR